MQRVAYWLAKQRDPRRDEHPEAFDFPTREDAHAVIREMKAEIDELFPQLELSPRNVEIFRRKLDGESSQDIARHVGCTKSQVNRVVKWIVAQLRNLLEKNASSDSKA